MTSAGRGPDQFAIALDSWRRRVQAIDAAFDLIDVEYKGLRHDVEVLGNDGVEPKKHWKRARLKYFEELKREDEPEVEHLLPPSVRAVV